MDGSETERQAISEVSAERKSDLCPAALLLDDKLHERRAKSVLGTNAVISKNWTVEKRRREIGLEHVQGRERQRNDQADGFPVVLSLDLAFLVVETKTPPPVDGDGIETERACFLHRYEPDQVPRVCGPCRTLSAPMALPCPFLRLRPV